MPFQPQNVLTTLIGDHTNVAITWDNQYQCDTYWPVTGCTVAIQYDRLENQNGLQQRVVSYADATPYCAETPVLNNNVVVNNNVQRYVPPSVCTVPTSVLTGDLFRLTSGDSVYARIVCQNQIGLSIPSDVDNGAILPGVPSAPQNFFCADRNINSISVSWNAPLQDGGSPVTCYVITQRQVSGNNNFVNDVQTYEICRDGNQFNQFNTRTFTASGLTNGGTYIFTIVARNVAGNSVAAQAQCIACVNPNTPMNLREDRTLRTLNAFGLTWDEGFNNGAIGQTYTINYSYNDN